MANNDELVNLIIDAQNLSSDEINRAASDVEDLGDAARRAEKELDKLKVDQETINSFGQMKSELTRMRGELARAEVEYDDLSKAVRQNTNATNEEREAVKLAHLQLKEQRSAVRSTTTEYNRLRRQLKDVGLSTLSAAAAQEQLNDKLEAANRSVRERGIALERLTNQLREQVAAERESIGLADQSEDATDAVTIALRRYEQALEALNREQREGSLSTGDYIRREEQLRTELGLTAAQVRARRLAVQADSSALSNGARSTDALTRATRRLAQAYVVIIAAQQASRAVGESVKGYGELEAAITKVEKTTGIAREQIAEMSDELREMAEDVTPSAANELLRYAEVAGQLGVDSTEDILKIAGAADALEISTSLAGDEAATLLTRILGMTNEGIPSIDALASSVVTLGNGFAASETEIVHMTKEIVSGTRSIDLGSAAAAAFGVTLKELGQPAERSRTAIQRMAESIRSASLKGGDDLERLMNLTGLTADTIEEDLGERPEKVLIAFLEGLSRVKSEGGLVSESLKAMGIEGQEANSVLGILSDSTGRLNEALVASNQAFIEQDAHFKEAAKAYADQEAAVGRLVNKFTSLKVDIGEAYSDETDAAIRGATELLEDQGDEVVALMQKVGELTEGLVEFVDLFGDLGDAISIGDLTFLDKSLIALKITFNAISVAVRDTAFAFNEARLFIAQYTGASEAALNKMRETSANLRKGVTEDLLDIERATLRGNGESNLSYENLQDAVTKYGDSISRLSEKQQKQIADAVKIGGFNAENTETYYELVAAIVRANRERESEIALLAKQEKANKKAIEIQKEKNKVISDAGERVGTLANQIEVLEQQRVKGVITDAKALELSNMINKVLEEQQAILTKLTTSEKEAAVVAEKAIVAAKKKQGLDESWVEIAGERVSVTGLLADSTSGLAKSNLLQADSMTLLNGEVLTGVELTKYLAEIQGDATAESNSFSESTNLLALSISNNEKKLKDLTNAVKNKTIVDSELYNVQLKMAKLNDEIKVDKEELARLTEYETQTIFELVEAKRKQVYQMELLDLRYRSGTMTAGEYKKALAAIKEELAIINDLLPENADEQSNNTVQVERRNVALQEQVNITRNLTEEVEKNSDSLVRNRGEMTEMTSSMGAVNLKAKALIDEIGLVEYNDRLHSLISYAGTGYTVDRMAVQRFEEEKDAAYKRSRGGDTSDGGTEPSGFGRGDETRHVVEIKLPSGATTEVAVNSVNDANSLVDAISSLGEININGVT